MHTSGALLFLQINFWVDYRVPVIIFQNRNLDSKLKIKVQNVQGLHGPTGVIKQNYITENMVGKNTVVVLTEVHLNERTKERIPDDWITSEVTSEKDPAAGVAIVLGQGLRGEGGAAGDRIAWCRIRGAKESALIIAVYSPSWEKDNGVGCKNCSEDISKLLERIKRSKDTVYVCGDINARLAVHKDEEKGRVNWRRAVSWPAWLLKWTSTSLES